MSSCSVNEMLLCYIKGSVLNIKWCLFQYADVGNKCCCHIIQQYTACYLYLNFVCTICTANSCAVFFSVSPQHQDYRWWWRTFLVSGGSAFYVLIYAVFYFVNKVKAHMLFHTFNMQGKLFFSLQFFLKWTYYCNNHWNDYTHDIFVY